MQYIYIYIYTSVCVCVSLTPGWQHVAALVNLNSTHFFYEAVLTALKPLHDAKRQIQRLKLEEVSSCSRMLYGPPSW